MSSPPIWGSRVRRHCRKHFASISACHPAPGSQGIAERKMSNDVKLLERLYALFNARDMESVLAVMHDDVVWANGMEGGHVHGRDGVREYWTRQWAMIDPHVEPVAFSTGASGEVIVEVHAVVRDLDGKLLQDKMVGHVFRIENELIRRFDIRET